MVSWSTIQSLLIFFGPIIYPRLRSFYTTIQNPPRPPHPLPPTSRYLLNLLFASCIISLLSTFPYFHPENVLKITNSRILHTSTDVIFNRLYSIRSALPSDTLLRSRFTSRDGRLLYSLYGPGPLTSCTWCRIDTPETFLNYALPSILFPHLIHIALLGLVTSARFLGGNNKAGSVWRTQATLAGLILAAGEVWYIFTYNHIQNISARTASESVYPYWQLITFRGLSIALVDAALGYAIYLTGTGRWGGLVTTTPAESLEEVASKLQNTLAAVNSSVCLKQAIMRDSELRDHSVRFWEAEELTGRELSQVEDVQAARRRVERRADWVEVKREAKKRATAVARGLFVQRPPMDDDEGDWDAPPSSQEVKQEPVDEDELSNTQQSGSVTRSGYFDEDEEFIGTQEEEELQVEGMQ